MSWQRYRAEKRKKRVFQRKRASRNVWTTLHTLLSNERKMKNYKRRGKVDCHSFLVALDAVGQEVLREDKEIFRNNNIYVGPEVEKLQSCCAR